MNGSAAKQPANTNAGSIEKNEEINVSALLNKTAEIIDGCHTQMDQIEARLSEYLPDDMPETRGSDMPDLDTQKCREIAGMARTLEELRSRMSRFHRQIKP